MFRIVPKILQFVCNIDKIGKMTILAKSTMKNSCSYKIDERLCYDSCKIGLLYEQCKILGLVVIKR